VTASLILRDAGRSCTFRLRRRAGVWEVTRDHLFHGDYLTRGEALRSACSAALSFEAAGGTASVVATPGDTPIAHRPARPGS